MVHSLPFQNVFIYGCDSKYFDAAENHPSRYLPKTLDAIAPCTQGARKVDSHALFPSGEGLDLGLYCAVSAREIPIENESRIFPAMLGNKCGMFNFQVGMPAFAIFPIEIRDIFMHGCTSEPDHCK
jgi:hypothetical protein